MIKYDLNRIFQIFIMENIEFQKGTNIGSYQIQQTIGSGAFSTVVLVKNIKTGQYYACKIIPFQKLYQMNMMERFECEIRVMQQLHHPNIVQFSDLIKDKDYCYIIMEFCSNGELLKYILDYGKLSEDQARPIIIQVLQALDYIHRMHITHRDLKPENILIDSRGNVKISDFGLSRFFSDNYLVKTPCGSPCYASPECLSGYQYNGSTTDLWSLGVIFFVMVTGKLPWTCCNKIELYHQICSGDYTIPDYISKPCASLIRGLLTVSPNHRLTAQQALAHPWVIKTTRINDAVLEKMVNVTQHQIETDYLKLPQKIVTLSKVDDFFERNVDTQIGKDEWAQWASPNSSQRVFYLGVYNALTQTTTIRLHVKKVGRMHCGAGTDSIKKETFIQLPLRLNGLGPKKKRTSTARPLRKKLPPTRQKRTISEIGPKWEIPDF